MEAWGEPESRCGPSILSDGEGVGYDFSDAQIDD